MNLNPLRGSDIYVGKTRKIFDSKANINVSVI